MIPQLLRPSRKNNVQLPDEYDQILKDLAPYRGFAPRELRRRVKHLQTLRDTFSMTNKDGKLTMHSRKYDTGIKGADERAQGQFDFIKDVAKDIPDFEAVFAIHEYVSQHRTLPAMHPQPMISPDLPALQLSLSLTRT